MKVLVLGGTHGNERLGVDLVRLLRKRSIAGVDTYIANPRAVQAERRFVETDLNRSFGGALNSYESRQARRLQSMARGYDIVLDFHNTMTPGNNCGFVGEFCDPLLYTVCGALSLKQCIVATYDCINKYCPNALSIEVSMGDPCDNAEYWYSQLSEKSLWSSREATALSVYELVGRVSWQQSTLCGTTLWRPFKQLPEQDQEILGFTVPVYPIFIGSRLTEYYCSLLIRRGGVNNDERKGFAFKETK